MRLLNHHPFRLLAPLLALLLPALPLQALEVVSDADAPITIYQTEDNFDTVKVLIQTAIVGKGLIITNTLHISDMYQRTAGDLGLEKTIYEHAEAFEFCSILLSYKMAAADPSNLAICPLTIGFYQPSGTQTVFVTFSNARMMGDASAVEQELFELLDGIVREALE